MRTILVFLLAFSLVQCASTPKKRSLGETLDDAVISNKLKTRYMGDKRVKAFKLNVDTWKGVVTLKGRLESQDQINHAIEMAERMAGVREVKSHLRLEEDVEEKTVHEVIE